MGGDPVADGATLAVRQRLAVGHGDDAEVPVLGEEPGGEVAGDADGLSFLGCHANDQPAVGGVRCLDERGVDEVERRGLHGLGVEVPDEVAGRWPALTGGFELAGGCFVPGELGQQLTSAGLCHGVSVPNGSLLACSGQYCFTAANSNNPICAGFIPLSLLNFDNGMVVRSFAVIFPSRRSLHIFFAMVLYLLVFAVLVLFMAWAFQVATQSVECGLELDPFPQPAMSVVTAMAAAVAPVCFMTGGYPCRTGAVRGSHRSRHKKADPACP